MPQSKAPPERRHFAAGDYITRFPPGSAEEILIDSPREKRGWTPRTAGTTTRPMFPGATVQIDGRYYEIIRITRRPGEKLRYFYYLSSWPDSFPIRTQFAYTRQECERAAVEEMREKEESVIRTVLTVLSPLVGLLPGPDQRKLENTYGISAMRCTVLSAIMTLMAGIFAQLAALVAFFSPESLQGWPIIGIVPPLALGLVGAVLGAESVLRLVSIKNDEPMGSFLVTVPLECARTLRHGLDPSSRRKRFEKMETGGASIFLNARDAIREINDTDLEVVSILPKPNWTPLTGISFNETWYGCIESGTQKTGGEVRYRFVLRKAPAGTVFRTRCRYSPEEVRDRYRDKRRQDLGTWVETFAPLWGLLSKEDQKKLQQIYGFKPLKYTAWTIAILAVIGAANILVSSINMAADVATPFDAVWLVCSGYFFLESILRLQTWLKNEPSGSVLGILLRPFASKLLNV